MHDPEQVDKAAEARRLGGARRRKESTLALVYDLGDLATVSGIRRLLEVVIADGLALEPGVNRLRVLLAGIGAATKLLEAAGLAGRIEALEATLRREQPARPTTDPRDGLLESDE